MIYLGRLYYSFPILECQPQETLAAQLFLWYDSPTGALPGIQSKEWVSMIRLPLCIVSAPRKV